MHIQDTYIAKIISAYAKGTISVEELKKLNHWLEDEQNKKLFERSLDKSDLLQKSFEYDQYNEDRIWGEIDKQLFGRKLYLQWLKYAAAILVPFFMGISIWLVSDRGEESILFSKEIKPGTQKATVILSDGSSIELDSETTNFLTEGNQIVGRDSSQTLAYNDFETDKLVYNTVRIPYGGEYQLILSDGTKVWLNSGSVLKFPVNFIGDVREVSIKGEALFHVAHDAGKVFKVHTDHSEVNVYGTIFNVMSYEDDKVEQITLVEGSVGVNRGGQQVMIQPGQQAQIAFNTPGVAIKEVDTSLITGWTKGVMAFKNMPLRELSKRIARWYDVDFYFANSNVADFGFSGKFDRDCDFELLMELLERTTNVKIEVEGRTVVVKELK